MAGNPKWLIRGTLRACATRGGSCRARQSGSARAVECRGPGRERPPSGALFPGPALARGSLTPRQPVQVVRTQISVFFQNRRTPCR